MKRIAWLLLIGLLISPIAWAEEDALVSTEGFSAVVGVEGRPGAIEVDPRLVNPIVNKQNEERLAKFEDIKKNGVLSKDDNGNPIYIKDGVKHSFGDGNGGAVTVEEYIKKQKEMNKEFEKGAGEIAEAYDEALKLEEKRIEVGDDVALMLKENKEAREKARIKNQAEADRVGLHW